MLLVICLPSVVVISSSRCSFRILVLMLVSSFFPWGWSWLATSCGSIFSRSLSEGLNLLIVTWNVPVSHYRLRSCPLTLSVVLVVLSQLGEQYFVPMVPPSSSGLVELETARLEQQSWVVLEVLERLEGLSEVLRPVLDCPLVSELLQCSLVAVLDLSLGIVVTGRSNAILAIQSAPRDYLPP